MKEYIQRLQVIVLECCLVIGLLYMFFAGAGSFPAVQAQPGGVTFMVTTTNDDSPGSLRGAILSANLTPGDDDIAFDIAGCTPTTPCIISLLSPLPTISDSLTISGTEANSLIIDANDTFRGLDIDHNVPVTIADLTIQNGYTPDRGAGIRSFGPLMLIRMRLLNNHAEDYGGGVYAEDELTVIDGHFEHNSSPDYGGGLHTDSFLALENTNFISNTADRGGGASGYDVSIMGGRFEQNAGDSEGGGLFANNTAVLTGTVFHSNTVGGYGGGMSAGDAWVSQSWFENNRSQDSDGGGLYACCSLVVENSTFLKNTAANDDGGGVFTSYAVLTGTTFVSNTASSLGGGLYALADAQITQGRFEGNVSMEDGGGLYVEGALDTTEAIFRNNVAHEHGGGALVFGEVRDMAGHFEGNESTLDGGGLLGYGSIHLVDTWFTGNMARDGGGLSTGFVVMAANSGNQIVASNPQVVLTRTHFLSNTATDFGGGVSTDFPIKMDSNTLIGNDAYVGGGLYHGQGNGLIRNTLFARNLAGKAGTALALDSPGTVSMVHTTVVGDSEQTSPGIGLTAGTLTLLNSIVTQHSVGILNLNGVVKQDYNLFFHNDVDVVGNVNGGLSSRQGDPRFVAPEVDDYHLSATSAALDMGKDEGILVDFEGQPRPLGSGFDAGFDEADLIAGLAITFSPNPTTSVNVPTHFTATISGGSGVSYTWDFGDGSPPQSGNPALHSYSAPGIYSVIVTATNSSGSLSTFIAVEVVAEEIAPLQKTIFLSVIMRDTTTTPAIGQGPLGRYD